MRLVVYSIDTSGRRKGNIRVRYKKLVKIKKRVEKDDLTLTFQTKKDRACLLIRSISKKLSMSNRDSDHREDDLQSIILEQRRELMAAQALDSDLDFAFHLQLQEALAASLALQPSTSTSTSSIPEPHHTSTTTTENGGVSSFTVLQSDELEKLVQEVKDREASELEMRRVREDLNRRIHDEKFAREILRIPEDDWKEWGDNYEKPLPGEGCSKSKPVADNNNDDDDAVFRIYTKGLVSVEEIRGVKTALAGIGVAICDPNDNVIFQVRKPLVGNGMSKNAAEAKALIDGLNAAIALELKRVTVYFDYNPLYQFVCLSLSLSLPRFSCFIF